MVVAVAVAQVAEECRVAQHGAGVYGRDVSWQDRRMSTRCFAKSSLALGCVLLLTACWEEPVRQTLQFRFMPEGDARVELRVEWPGDAFVEAAEEKRRFETERLLAGDDVWMPRFAALRPAAEEQYWRKENGGLRRFVRTAEIGVDDLTAPESALERFWQGTPIYSTYRRDEVAGVLEWALYPGPSDRATRREQRQIDKALTAWSEDIATYLDAVDLLYADLERHPERALLCFATLFETDDDLPPVTEDEERLLQALADSLTHVVDIFDRPSDETESLEELSRRVFDPFGARITAELPGPPSEVEGFVAEGDGWAVPGLSFWQALRHLEHRWVEPNLLVVAFEEALEDREVDPIALADTPRRSDPPVGASEVEEALRKALEPKDVYRLVWPMSHP